MCDAASHASIYDAEPSDFTKTQMKKNHARQIYFHRSNFYFYRKSVNYLFQWKIIQRNCNFTRPVFRMKRGPSSLNLNALCMGTLMCGIGLESSCINRLYQHFVALCRD